MKPADIHVIIDIRDNETVLERTREQVGDLSIDSVDLHVPSGGEKHASITFNPERWLLFAAQVEAFTAQHFGRPS